MNLQDNNIDTLFRLSDIPNYLEELNLSNKGIENNFFDEDLINNNVKYLYLHNNNLELTSSLLYRIILLFPKLEILSLFGNRMKNLSSEINFGDDLNPNCVRSVSSHLNKDKLKNRPFFEDSNSDFKLYNDYKVEVSWKKDDLPAKVIISYIENHIYDYLEGEERIAPYRNGWYINDAQEKMIQLRF